MVLEDTSDEPDDTSVFDVEAGTNVLNVVEDMMGASNASFFADPWNTRKLAL